MEVYKGVEKEKQNMERMSAQKKELDSGDQERKDCRMKDNNIIKALEICIDFASGGEAMCKNCPLYDCNNCSSEQRKQALDLINRQQKKIKKLENIEHFATKTVEKQEKEIERLTIEKDNLIRNYRQCMTEAIKEFAERLNGILKKKRKNKQSLFAKTRYGECILAVDNLVKEMTEVKNNE